MTEVITKLGKQLGSVYVPFYRNIINFSFNSYESVMKDIESLNKYEREWEKVNILVNCTSYIQFLTSITNCSDTQVVQYLNEFYKDKKFRDVWEAVLYEFESNYSDTAGDVRFNSLSLYAIIRALKPSVVVETGVAAGKSSTLILLAMEHNNKGNLISIDLPNYDGKILEDGGRTSTKDKPVGWLVPDYLRDRWKLILGDSIKELPKLMGSLEKIDVFFHDSLHTYKHVSRELEIVDTRLSKGGVILIDDIDAEAGLAFEKYLDKNNLIAYAYRELAGVKIKS